MSKETPKGIFCFDPKKGTYKNTEIGGPMYDCKDPDELVAKAIEAAYKYGYQKGRDWAESNVKHVVNLITPDAQKPKAAE